ncbi:MAG TPA: lysophospholipid acyltransferase family protein [Kiloniellaceae bacterium]|nr:lysophospholipid acyltransferase family protein [Kiloniellaceae bacterium]
MLFLRSLLFNIVFWLWTTVFLTLCLPLLLTPPIVSYHIGVVWTRFTFFALKWICGITYELRGMEHLPPDPVLVACKHQSAWDTMIFALIMRHPSFVMKRSLKRIPLFGWFLSRSGMVAIDRDAGASALKGMLREARKAVAAGRTVVIFPEGTRTRPGKSLPYHPGVFALYRDLGLPTVPIALNSGLYWGRDAFVKRPGRIVFEILPPMPAGLPRKTFMTDLEAAIEGRTAALVAEGRSKGNSKAKSR